MSIKENPIASSITLNGQRYNIISDIQRLYADTPAGFRLSYEQVRWPYRPEDVSMYEWQSSRILGADANNFKHGALTVGEARWLMKQQNNSDSEIKFDKDDQEIICAISQMHDTPEGLTKKGDVPYEKKTLQDVKNEELVMGRGIIEALGDSGDNRYLAYWVNYYLSEEGIKKTIIGEFFNAVEKFGYVRTGLQAWKKSREFINSRPILSDNLTLIANNVLINNLPTLIKYSSKYVGIKTYLQIQKDTIDQAFAMDPSYMDKYDDKSKIPGYKIGFERSKSKWIEWKTKNANMLK